MERTIDGKEQDRVIFCKMNTEVPGTLTTFSLPHLSNIREF